MSFKKTAIALGSFDGLHKGHMSVIACTLKLQKECGLLPVVLLFDTHPLQILVGTAPNRLLQNDMRDEKIKNLGAEICVIPFEKTVNMSCREFFEKVLIEKLNAGAVCCGANYRFGKENAGDCNTLASLCDEFGIRHEIAPSVDYGSSLISSTRIRAAIENGDISLANAMLGRDFSYRLPVVDGCHRGRLIGAPTINQRFEKGFVIPKKGVYASCALVNEKLYPAVTNIGLRPSFENEDFRSETYIPDFSGNLYGKKIEVRLIEFLRDEIKFDSVEELSEKIHADANRAIEIFNNRGDFHV